MTDTFTSTRLVPALKECGLTTDEIVGQRYVQETVYWLEHFGCNLGYRFKWELIGPFSRELAEDVEGLDRATVDAAPAGHISDAGEKVAALLDSPDELELAEAEWLRLLVAVDFVERRIPGATENGGAPAFIQLNYSPDAISAARDAVFAAV
jgi:hypothetical protein